MNFIYLDDNKMEQEQQNLKMRYKQIFGRLPRGRPNYERMDRELTVYEQENMGFEERKDRDEFSEMTIQQLREETRKAGLNTGRGRPNRQKMIDNLRLITQGEIVIKSDVIKRRQLENKNIQQLKRDAKDLGYRQGRGRPNKKKLLDFIIGIENMRGNITLDEVLKQQKILNLIREEEYQQILNDVINAEYDLSNFQAKKVYDKITSGDKKILNIILKDGKKHTITINKTTEEFIVDLLRYGVLYETENKYGSDIIDSMKFFEIETATIEIIRPRRKMNNNGSFFRYINTTDIDLARYQIYNQKQSDKVEDDEHCLINTLKYYDVEESVINSIKLMYVKNQGIPKKDLVNISKMINKNIELYQYEKNVDNKRLVKKLIENNYNETIRIGLYEDHYFINERTIYSKMSVLNYANVKDIKNFNNIIHIKRTNKKNYYTFDETKNKLDSIELIHLLYTKGKFEILDFSNRYESSRDKVLKEHFYLDNIESEQREVPFHLNNIAENIIIADTETLVNPEYYSEHSLFLIGYSHIEEDEVKIINVCDYDDLSFITREKRAVNTFLDDITRGIDITNKGKHNISAVVYFHNLKYDFSVLSKHLSIKSICEKDGQIYNVVVRYKKYNIEFRDSYKMIPIGLPKFNEELGLDDDIDKKEAISYKYYTEKNYNRDVHIDEYMKHLSSDLHSVFIANMKEETSYNSRTGYFNPFAYYKKYLKYDVLTLKAGLKKFDEIICEITDGMVSVYGRLTISSLTDAYMNMRGVYEDVYEIRGNLRHYVSKSIYGGRVCVNKKYEKTLIEGQVSDYDGVSLYSSAIDRLCKEGGGIPKGKAKRFDKGELSDWGKMDYCILTVKILSVNKKQQIPFITHRSRGSIDYKNEAPIDPVIIDKVTLEDYIKFHKIEYEILDGVYWNNGKNDMFGDVINELFQKRLQYKNTNKGLSNVLKLMMNSAYGKTIMKSSNEKISIIKKHKNVLDKKTGQWTKVENFNKENYIYRNFDRIKSFEELNEDDLKFKMLQADETYNRGHIGSLVLSMSKRIMNEVFNVANDAKLVIYYSDTDSMHLNLEDIAKLEKLYYDTYRRELKGKQLGQFHTDFELEGAVGEIYATKSIFLGKKTYMDKLESVDENGKKIEGYHIRMKGITKEGLEHAAKQYDNSYLDLYQELMTGVEKEILLNPTNDETNKEKVMFQFGNNFVKTRGDFVRTVKF